METVRFEYKLSNNQSTTNTQHQQQHNRNATHAQQQQHHNRNTTHAQQQQHIRNATHAVQQQQHSRNAIHTLQQQLQHSRNATPAQQQLQHNRNTTQAPQQAPLQQQQQHNGNATLVQQIRHIRNATRSNRKVPNTDNSRRYLQIPVITEEWREKIQAFISVTNIQQFRDSFVVYFGQHIHKNLTMHQTGIIKYCAKLCLETQRLFHGLIPKLRSGKNEAVGLSKERCCCLLSLVLFGFFKDTENVSFEYILTQDMEKLKCLLSYFEVMKNLIENSNTDSVEFHRYHFLDDKEITTEVLNLPLCDVQVKNGHNFEQQKIESNSLQLICTNQSLRKAYVLNDNRISGSTRFFMSPECLLCYLLCENIDPTGNEVIFIKGLDTYSQIEFHDVSILNVHKSRRESFKHMKQKHGQHSSDVLLYYPVSNKTNQNTEQKDFLQSIFLGMVNLFSVADLAKNRTVSFNVLDCSDTPFGYELEFIMKWIVFSMFDVKMKCYNDGGRYNWLRSLSKFVHMQKHKTVDQLLTALMTYIPRTKEDIFEHILHTVRSKTWSAYFKNQIQELRLVNDAYQLQNHYNLLKVYMMLILATYAQMK